MIVEEQRYVCLKCQNDIARGATEHRCVDRGDGGAYSIFREWRCECDCRTAEKLDFTA